MTENSTINFYFWSYSQLLGTDETQATGQRQLQGGLPADSYGNSISFIDSLGQTGVKVGYVQLGTTTDNFADDLGNGWVDTGEEVDPAGWHRWEVTLDLARDLASIAIQPSETAAIIPLVTSQPMNAIGGFREMLG